MAATVSRRNGTGYATTYRDEAVEQAAKMMTGPGEADRVYRQQDQVMLMLMPTLRMMSMMLLMVVTMRRMMASVLHTYKTGCLALIT
jgi:hypothetical protein